jgi:hypothetical protein
MEVGGILLTRDKHFELVDQIEAVVLRKGQPNQSP